MKLLPFVVLVSFLLMLLVVGFIDHLVLAAIVSVERRLLDLDLLAIALANHLDVLAGVGQTPQGTDPSLLLHW